MAGLTLFVGGFAVAGVLVAAGRAGSPPYLAGVSIGLLGVGLVGFSSQRGAAQLPPGQLWSQEFLRAVLAPLRLPPRPVIAVLYSLAALGVIGNLLVPFARHR